MNKTFIIFRHEFLKTLRRTGFIVLTLSLQVLALLGIGIMRFASGAAKPPSELIRLGYVDESGGFSQFMDQGNIKLVRFDTEESAKQGFINKDIKEYFVIGPDYISTGRIKIYIPQNELAPSDSIKSAIGNFISSNMLAGKIPPDVIARVESPLNVISTTLTSTGAVAPQQVGYTNFIIPGVFSFLLAFSLIFTSSYVLQSLGEEKENRLMEILISSVSTRQLLAGKVLGLGLAGLVQVIVWVISFPLLLKLASSSIGGLVNTLRVPPYFWVLGVLYFILGYLFIATISASIAAVTSTVQEAQGIAGLYSLFNIAPFWLLSLLLSSPSNPAWIVFTIFPLSAPVLTMMRLGLIGVPAWQLAVSLVVLALSIIGGLVVAARLLRVYMLMYGKRPNLAEIMRNFRNA